MPIALRFPITLALSIVCLATPARADFQAGNDAYNRKDYETALREWKPLAEQGNADAQYTLGAMYDKGKGVPQDYVQARQWYEQAAAQGHAKAQVNLGLLYDKGQGVPQDYGQARHWWEKAAAQGFAKAQYILGVLYHKGRSGGVQKDYVKAHMWYNLAGANGYKDSVTLRDALTKYMNYDQIEEAQKLAREWKPTMP